MEDFDIENIGKNVLKATENIFDEDIYFNSRYIRPKQSGLVPTNCVTWRNAIDFAKSIKLEKDMRVYAIISGEFIMGDFIEALIRCNDLKVKKLTIATLSMNLQNIDSLWRMQEEEKRIAETNLILSGMFYRYEKKGLVRKLYENLDKENKLQVAIFEHHLKIIQFETERGNKMVISGSANMRASQSLEQIYIEQNDEVYDFNQIYFNHILDKFKTIEKGRNHKNQFTEIENLLTKKTK
jgi:hypothetical protein